MTKKALIEWLEDRARHHATLSHQYLQEAYTLRIHMSHSKDPWSDRARVIELDGLAANHMQYAVGLRLEANELKQKKGAVKPC